MIKKYSVDILCALIIFAVAFLFSERATIEFKANPSASQREKQPQGSVEKPGTGEIVRETGAAKPFSERNIFRSEGTGISPGAGRTGQIPKTSYALVGILQGEEKRAVFRDSGGAIVTLTVGKNLADGSIVTRIDDLSVELEKGKERKDVRVFDLSPQKNGKRIPTGAPTKSK
jgi:hypothetical protein